MESGHRTGDREAIQLPRPGDLVLVAVVPSRRDLEIARILGWYRIPMRSAPRVILVDYLAFYQLAAFGERRWRIEWVAPVRGHEMVTRVELLRDEPEHPRAREEYYQVQLGPLSRLPHPVLAARWKRLTFLYTTGERLLAAHTLQDLIIGSQERQVLWRTLRERASQAGHYNLDDLPEAELSSDLLADLLGILTVGDSD